MSIQRNGTASDDELVRLAQSGDGNAADLLVYRYSEIAKMKAAKLCACVQLHDIDDLTQEAMLGLLSAVFSFSPDKTASFVTYANVCMNNRLLSVAKAMRAKRLIPESAIISLDEVSVPLDNAINCDPQELALTAEKAERISALLSTELSAFEQKVIRLFLSGCSYADIASQLLTDDKAVDNAMQRIRRKLRSAL